MFRKVKKCAWGLTSDKSEETRFLPLFFPPDELFLLHSTKIKNFKWCKKRESTESPPLLMGIQLDNHFGKQFGISVLRWILTLGYGTKETPEKCKGRDMCKAVRGRNVCNSRNSEQSKCSLRREWMDCGYSHMMEYSRAGINYSGAQHTGLSTCVSSLSGAA